MNRTVALILIVLLAGLSWIFFQRFTIVGLQQVRVERRTVPPSADAAKPGESLGDRLWRLTRQPFVARSQGDRSASKPSVIRVATFHVPTLNEASVDQPQVMDILTRITRRFDVVAIQGIRTEREDVLPRLVESISRSGVDYDFALGPRLGPSERQEQYGFLFNRRTVELDRSELYTVEDRDDLFTWDPLVAWFRAAVADPAEAFTFTLVNVRIDSQRALQERDLLDDLIRVVREDGRGEDDVILAGDLQFAAGQLGDLEQMAGIACAVASVSTSTARGTAWDNLVFQRTATVEFTGRGEVVDFLREYNLTLPEALEVSDHLPVWAEFSIYEGGRREIAAVSPAAIRNPSDFAVPRSLRVLRRSKG